MKEWYTAQEIASLMGVTDRGIRKKANSEDWTSRPKAAGKGLEYHVSSLPNEIKPQLINISIETSKRAKKGVELAKNHKSSATSVEKQQALVDFNKLSSRQKKLATCKFEVIKAVSSSNLSVEKFIQAYNDKDVFISDEVASTYPRLRKATVYEWKDKYSKKGLVGLAGKRGAHRKNSGAIDVNEDLKDFIIGMVVEHPHISNTVLYKAIKTEFKDSDTLPSLRTVDRWVAKWKDENKQVFCAITSPDEWKNQYMAAFGHGSEQIKELNQLWEFDSTPADLMLSDGRHTIIGVIDVYSRRIKFIVSRTSNSKGVAQVIRQAIIDWGIPKVAKTDNGSDYKSKYIQSIFDALDIKQEFCPPFQAWKKPHIERVFRSFSHDMLELLDGFIGHNVADRKQIESRKQFSDRLFKKDEIIDVNLTSDELQDFCDNWIDNEYHIRTHGALKKSPLEMVRDWEGSIYRIEDERALDILLSEPGGYRVIGKKGIKLDGGEYINPALAGIVGDEVQVYYDEHDMGRIYVYDMQNEFVCIAEDPSITGVSSKEVAQKAKEIQREAVQEEKRRLKAATKKLKKRDIAKEILAHQAQQNIEQNTLSFPRPSQIHTSDRLESAADALAAKDGLTSTYSSIEQQSEIKAIQEQIKGQLIQPEFKRSPTLPSDPAEKYNFWVTMDKKVKSGLEIEEIYQDFYKNFPSTAEYKSGEMLADLRQQTASK